MAGSKVKGLKKGDRVAMEPGVPCGKCECCRTNRYHQCPEIRFFGTFPTHGTYRVYVVHPAQWVYKLPAGVSLQEGAMVEPLSVSVHAAGLSTVGACNTIAVLGMGSIGLTCLQVLRMNRAHTIFATDRIVPRLKLAKKLGADRIINIDKEDPIKTILKETGGRGVDFVFEAAGQLDAHHHAAEIMRPGGEMVIIGIPPEDKLGFKAGTVRRKELLLKPVRRMRYTYGPSLELVKKGLVDVKCLVTHTYSLKNIVKAFKLVEDYADGVIKAVIKI
jgi:L-iditol 2-dehydrogenase